MTTGKITVLLADDQRVVRQGVALVLELIPDVEIVGMAQDGLQAVDMAQHLAPDVVLMDLRMPGCDGIEATRRITAVQGGTTKVLVLTTYADDVSVLAALRAGAAGYLTKDAGVTEISDALERIRRGQAVLDPAVQQHLVDAIVASDDPPTTDRGPRPAQHAADMNILSPREIEVLCLIASGSSNADIANTLTISMATVKSHVNHVLAKTNARDRAQAVSLAYQMGLISGDVEENHS